MIAQRNSSFVSNITSHDQVQWKRPGSTGKRGSSKTASLKKAMQRQGKKSDSAPVVADSSAPFLVSAAASTPLPKASKAPTVSKSQRRMSSSSSSSSSSSEGEDEDQSAQSKVGCLVFARSLGNPLIKKLVACRDFSVPKSRPRSRANHPLISKVLSRKQWRH